MRQQFRHAALVNPPTGLAPIPDWIRSYHRARVKDWNFFGVTDYNVGDWNANVVGGGAAAIAVTNGAATPVNGPMLGLTAAANNDGIGLRHSALHLAMPFQGNGHSFYLAFDVVGGSSTTLTHRAFGIASGTAAEAFNLDTGALFSAGAGIMWESLSSNGLWTLTLKPSAKAAQVIATSTLSPASSNAEITRLGFMYVANPDAGAAIGKIYPFCFLLNEAAFSGDETDDQDSSASGFLPSAYGVTLNDTLHGDVENVQCGVFIGHATQTAAARGTYVRRILSVDNMRR